MTDTHDLAAELFDLDGRYGCLNRRHTRLVQVSESQAGLLERVESLAREAAGTDNATRRQLLLLDIIAATGNGAAALRKALDAPITIRTKED